MRLARAEETERLAHASARPIAIFIYQVKEMTRKFLTVLGTNIEILSDGIS